MSELIAARSKRRLVVAAAVAGGGLLLTGAGVYAALNATAFNTTSQTVNSGTLKVTLADNGAGFTTAISNLAPGDVVKRYVALTNGGTLDAKNLTLAVTDSASNALTGDATRGLQLTVTSCPTAWTVTGGGSCSGTSTLVLTGSLNALKSTPGALTTTVLAGAVQNLQFTLTLPDAPNNETTVNGVLPNPAGGTIQGLTAGLTWTFTEAQRTATTTSS